MTVTEPGWRWTGHEREPISRPRWSVPASVISGPDALVLTAFLLLAVRLLSTVSASFNVDTWLELTSGRLIWHAGIPHLESLTTAAMGKPWIDQQWLAQIIAYTLYRIGGLGLLGVVNVTCLVSGLAMAATSARKLGASVRAVLTSMVVCAWLLLPATEVRTQAFAIPLFALTVHMLARDARHPSWRVWWVLPILVLWGNLHGSASLGAALVVLRGVTIVWERRTDLMRSLRPAARPLGLILGGPLCLLLTPYGLQSVTYYESTLANSALRHTVTEWQPITSSVLVAAPFFCLVAAMIWSFGRFDSRTTVWDRLAFLVLAAASVEVIRNVSFFAVASLALVPVSLGGGSGRTLGVPSALRRRINTSMIGMASVITAVTAVIVLARPVTTPARSYPSLSMLAAVNHATRAEPGIKVVADTRYADWLLWHAPWLAGRIAADARFELYTARQTYAFQDFFSASGIAWKQAADGYRLIVLNRSADSAAVAGLRSEPGATVLYEDQQTMVIRRPSPAR